MTFLFCVYAFMRGCTLLDYDIDFESFVDLLHGKTFKYIRPGSAKQPKHLIESSESQAQQRHITTTVTPEVLILQVDLLTTCTNDMKSDKSQLVIETENKRSPTPFEAATATDEATE